MKKSIYNLIKYDIYKYAPESFKLFIVENGKSNQIILSESTTHKLGCTVITKGELGLEKEVKKLFRKNGFVSNKEKYFNFGIMLKNTDEYVSQGLTVKQYDIIEHLKVFKDIKEALKENNYKRPIKMTMATLNGKYEVKKIEEKTEIVELSKKIYFKAI